MRNVFSVKLILAACLFSFTATLSYAAAQNSNSLSLDGLSGEELTAVAVSSKNPDVVLLGTTGGLYYSDSGGAKAWKKIADICREKPAVRQIVFNASGAYSAIATQKGLFLLNMETGYAKKVFSRSRAGENDCLSVVFGRDEAMTVGTSSGLFYREASQSIWMKVGVFFDDKPVLFLSEGADHIIFAATADAVYARTDNGAWRQVWNHYSHAEEMTEATEEETQEDAGPSGIRHMTTSPDKKALFVATASGIIKTDDRGEHWTRLPLAGLDYTSLRFILARDGGWYALSDSGLYERQHNQWTQRLSLNAATAMAFQNSNIIMISKNDVLAWRPMGHSGTDGGSGLNEENKNDDPFKNEPSVQEVQKMAIAYCDVTPEKIKNWHHRASIKALLPKVSVGNDVNIWGSSTGAVNVGPRTWDYSLSWDVSELVFSTEQTSIDVRSKLMVELRNDILAEVTRLYFERRKIQLDMLEKGAKAGKDNQLKLEEVTALIDRFTGGNYSRVLKRIN